MKQIPKISLFAVVILGISTILNLEVFVVGPLINFKYLIILPLLFIGFIRPMIITLRTFTQTYNKSGGSYIWIANTLGKKFAFFVSVMQWYATLIWFPSITILSAQVLSQSLNIHVQHYQFIAVLIYLSGVLLNLSGVKFFHNFAAKLAILMFFIPFGIVFVVWLQHLLLNPYIYYHVLRTNLDYHLDLNLLLLLYGSVCGSEVIFTHFEEIKSNPKKLKSVIYLFNCLVPILYGTIGIILAYPFLLTHQVISDDILVIINTFFKFYNCTFLIRPILFLLTFAGILSFATWMLSASRVVQIGSYNLNLSIISKQQNNLSPKNLIFLELLIVGSYFLGSVFYDQVSNIAIYLIESSEAISAIYYLSLFIVAYKLIASKVDKFQLLLGIITSILVIVFGFIPPQSTTFANLFMYQLEYVLSLLFGCVVVPLLIYSMFNKDYWNKIKLLFT